MPREQTLNDPLSGAEIKQIALAKFAEALDRDCTLVDDICYPGFRLKFDATISFTRANAVYTSVWGNALVGDPPEEGTQGDLISGGYETDSPNTAREENDLPIPVMIQTPSGPKREKVKFSVPSTKR